MKSCPKVMSMSKAFLVIKVRYWKKKGHWGKWVGEKDWIWGNITFLLEGWWPSTMSVCPAFKNNFVAKFLIKGISGTKELWKLHRVYEFTEGGGK